MTEPQDNVHALNGRIGALVSWAGTTPAERTRRTERGRAALLEKYEREADPEGRLSPAQRAEAGQMLLQAHMLRMSQASRKARAKKTPKSRK